jgi:ribosomal protein S19
MKKIKSNKLLLINKLISFKSKEIKTKNRNLIIFPNIIGKTILVYNGKSFIKLLIKKEMVGYKLGEFVKTRKIFKFKKKIK